jgi:hypothetical protein
MVFRLRDGSLNGWMVGWSRGTDICSIAHRKGNKKVDAE